MNAAPNAVNPSQRPALTLLELVLILVILLAIVGLIATGIEKARFSAARSDCQNRIRNLSLAVLHYESSHGRLPPGAISGPFQPLSVPEDINHGMWTTMLGELELPHALNAYHWERNFDDAINEPVVVNRINILQCPALAADRMASWPDGKTAGVADYAPVIVNPFLADIAEIGSSENFDGVLPVNGVTKIVEVTDGVANTILISEAAGRPGMAWSSPEIPVGLKNIRGGQAHAGGANVAFCDGSSRFFNAGTDLKLLAKLATRAGNESLGDDW